ncbi:isocitrate dehydrogenase[NAD] subunit gamma, mitochondrial-like [Euroglyphus maynei]|uniref:Isocitrate dehydrogenase[NAD] subunit gamma, mitochondrial-like n=1 Tax=Euroglyphus maynei TaxID=6958 RepID=A0A1Y3B3X3_EURMA|nr:isocitrate dehydrogenase[NAD] subunit gamma, mitochondrial-like [Euroglyphus maynei]
MIEAITSILRNGAAIKGNIETREHSKYFLSRNVELRLRLNLFVNVVHCKSNPGIKTRHKDIDIVLIRQNTEGEYSCLEHESVDGVVESLKIVTREKTEQIARYAFDYARSHNRKKLTCVHKANIMKMADGLFLKVCTEIAKEYPDIEFNNMIIDNCSMQLVSNPNQFDVLLLPNLYGNILTNIACGLVGGPGITSGRNYGPTHAVFETGTRNTGKKVAGKNIANPIAMLNASVDLLDYLQLNSYADIVRDAIYKAINIEKLHTLDMGGNATTTDVVNFIIDEVNSQTKIKAYQAQG